MGRKGGVIIIMTHWNPYPSPEDGLPPKEIRFIELRTEPWPNQGQRVRVHLEISPFLERPNIQVIIARPDKSEVSSVHIIETIESRMVFTMHLKGDQENGPYTLKAVLFYPDIGTVDEKTITFNINAQGLSPE